MPNLTDDQWNALITVFVAAWELVDTPEGEGQTRYTIRRDRLLPLREALNAFETTLGGDDPSERVEILIPPPKPVSTHPRPDDRPPGSRGRRAKP
jgi:hypothetical protein